LYFARFSFVHIGGPPIRSAFLESQPTHGTQQLSGQTLKTISEKLAAWRRYREAVRELSQLSDRELDDIGIRRGHIESVVRQSVMKEAS
jgi:uncharacterized protein YjiS (DUF1127 family)